MKKILINERQASLIRNLTDKKIVKITKEQYNRIFSETITEGTITPDTVNMNSSIAEGDNNLHSAALNLIRDIFKNPTNIGVEDFWVAKGIKSNELIDYLKKLNILKSTSDGRFYLGKTEKDQTIQDLTAILEKALESLISKKDATQAPTRTKSLEMEDNETYPKDLEQDVNKERKRSNGVKLYKAIAINYEIAILKDATDKLYVFDYSTAHPENFVNHDLMTNNTGYEMDLDDITDYVNDNIKTISKGNGLRDFERGVDLVKIDDPLKQDLLNLYDKSTEIRNALSGVNEMTGAASSGAFTGALQVEPIKRDVPPTIEEITSGTGSVGPYDANALPNIKRDGTFVKGKKTQAQVKTQYPKGGFVEMDKCTKYNNNKSAENGGCSTGAVDGVVKVKKGSGSVISKDGLFEEVAKRTGRTVDEVKRIISNKSNVNK